MEPLYSDNFIYQIKDGNKVYTYTNVKMFIDLSNNQVRLKNKTGKDYWVLTKLEYHDSLGKVIRTITATVDRFGNYNTITDEYKSQDVENNYIRYILLDTGNVKGDYSLRKTEEGIEFYKTKHVFEQHGKPYNAYLEEISYHISKKGNSMNFFRYHNLEILGFIYTKEGIDSSLNKRKSCHRKRTSVQ